MKVWLPAAAVIALCLALRFAYGFFWVGYPQLVENIRDDAADYLTISYSLAKTGRYERPGSVDVKRLLLTRQEPPASLRGEPDAIRPPVWPWVLSRLLRWSGYDLRIVFALRFLLDAVTLFLFFRLASIWLMPTAALLGTLLLAIHPIWLHYSMTLLTEPFILLVHILLGLFALTLVPWLMRNGRLYGRLEPVLNTSSGMNLAKGWNHEFLSDYRNGTAEAKLDENAEIRPFELEGLNQAERSAVYTSRALQYARTEWRTVPAILGKKLLGAVTPFPDPPRPGILETGRMLFQAITLVPMLWILFTGGRGPLQVLARALAAAYLLMALACFPALRYRFPLIWAEVLGLCLFLETFGKRVGSVRPG